MCDTVGMAVGVPLAIRLEERVVHDIDVLIIDGEALNRTEFIRQAIVEALDRARERRIDREIIAAFERTPETEIELDDLKKSSLQWIDDLDDDEW